MNECIYRIMLSSSTLSIGAMLDHLVYPSIVAICLSVYLSICLSVYLAICAICLSVYLSRRKSPRRGPTRPMAVAAVDLAIKAICPVCLSGGAHEAVKEEQAQRWRPLSQEAVGQHRAEL